MKDSGLTVIEVLVSIGVIAVLAAIGIFSYGPILARSESLRCMANMHSLQTSLVAYINDKAHWPQEPQDLWESEHDEAWEDWWIAELEPYDAPQEVWRCPSIFRVLQKKDPQARPRIHYLPSKFDHLALSPYRWSTQPWLVEIGDLHNGGGHILFPDGSIRKMSDFLPAKAK